MVENKDIYRNAQIEVVYTSESDVIATSIISNDSLPNYDSGGWA